jgi:hypothetical protein
VRRPIGNDEIRRVQDGNLLVRGHRKKIVISADDHISGRHDCERQKFVVARIPTRPYRTRLPPVGLYLEDSNMTPIWRDELASRGHVQVSIEDGSSDDLLEFTQG